MDSYAEANAVISKFCKSYMVLKNDLPIRPSEMGVLNIIVLRDGRFTPIMLAELLEVSKPMITAHISVLEKNGYVTKEYSECDKRSFYVVPTQKARELVATAGKTAKKHLLYLESELGSEEYQRFLLALRKANRLLANRKED